MKKQTAFLAATLCAAAMAFNSSSAIADSPPRTDALPSKASNAVAAMEEKASTDAFIAKKDAPESAIKGACSKAEARDSAAAYANSVKETARSLSDDPKLPRHIDKVKIAVKSLKTSKKSDGNFVINAQLDVSRHIMEDNIFWEEIVPHEIEMDAHGCILNFTVKDRSYYDKNPGNALPEDPKNASDPSPKASSDGSGAKPDQANQTQFDPVTLPLLNRAQKGKAASYAVKYAKEPNPSYREYDEDCTNFVSQAMFAGGWKEVYHFWVDYKWDNAWWYGGIPTNSWTWSGAENFYRMANGPKGLHRTKMLNSVYDLEVGDILQYKLKSHTNMTHTMIVTKKVSGMPYLSYHINSTLNKPLSDILKRTKDATWFAHRT